MSGKKEKPASKIKPEKDRLQEDSVTVENVNHSAIYKKNEKTGEWEVKNPAGSMAYNYLYRNEFDDDE